MRCCRYQALSMAYCGSADVGGRENAGKKPVVSVHVYSGSYVANRKAPQALSSSTQRWAQN